MRLAHANHKRPDSEHAPAQGCLSQSGPDIPDISPHNGPPSHGDGDYLPATDSEPSRSALNKATLRRIPCRQPSYRWERVGACASRMSTTNARTLSTRTQGRPSPISFDIPDISPYNGHPPRGDGDYLSTTDGEPSRSALDKATLRRIPPCWRPSLGCERVSHSRSRLRRPPGGECVGRPLGPAGSRERRFVLTTDARHEGLGFDLRGRRE